MSVYTDPRVLDVAGALDSLPSLPLNGSPDNRQELRATGTDDSRSLDELAKSFVAPTVAPNSGIWCNEQTIVDKSGGNPPQPAHEKNPSKQAVSRGLSRVANGSRTHDLRNHNPGDTDSKLLTSNDVTSSDLDGCTNGCTSTPDLQQLAGQLRGLLTESEVKQLIIALL